MSSTSKTENLGLSQWTGTDAVEMADFNADFQKIDADLGASLKWELLKDTVIPASDADTISIDVSDISFGDYMMFIIVFPNMRTSSLRLNDSSYISATVSTGTLIFGLPFGSLKQSCPIFYIQGSAATVSGLGDLAELQSLNLTTNDGTNYYYDVPVQIWGVK